MTTSAQVRSQLIDALRLDLVGPRPAEPGDARYRDEILPIAPSKWYLTGILVPYEPPPTSAPTTTATTPLTSRPGSLKATTTMPPADLGPQSLLRPPG